MSKLKPGAQKLFDYLIEHKSLLVKDFQQLFSTKQTLIRVIREDPTNFELLGDEVHLKKQIETEAPNYVEMRKYITHELEKFLVGPFKEDEILGQSQRPMQLYLTGKLVPFGSTASVENEIESDIEIFTTIDPDSIEERLVSRKIFRPSSMGLSFKMTELVPIQITSSWGMYIGDEHERKHFQETWTIPLSINTPTETLVNNCGSEPGRIRYTITERNNLYHISVFLFNSYERESFPLQSEVMFQTKLSVSLDEEYLGVFTSKADKFNVQDELLYRDFKESAIGHGVGVDWTQNSGKNTLYSTWMPFYELPMVEHTKIPNSIFSMKELSELSASELKVKLMLLPIAYNEWLDVQKGYVNKLDVHLKEEARKNIEQVESIIKRLIEGIQLVTKSDDCNEKLAFQFANRAMLIQRAQTKVASEYRSTGKRIQPEYTGEWRLFQIIFLLMNVAGSSDKTHTDRQIVDLIWFPTGGGKTEAYLGVAAYVMSYRRLSANIVDVSTYAGITVFMRYTLRLLTTQQFQRATALICAAEYLRQQTPHRYGDVPFSIGLWIGADSSPNNLEDAEIKLEELSAGNEVKKGNPMQLMNCPWCGTELTPDDYSVDVKNKTQHIICDYTSCIFHGEHGLPVYTVDEAIYQQLPTLLIGTVDKVAQLPWKSNMHELFGMKNLYHSKYGFIYENKGSKRGYEKIKALKPPELIIQDELHLISGPLGSLTGLYEVAIDLLTTDDGYPAKVIASTATISGAEEQIRSLYGREMMQFPMAIQQANDNFVSRNVNVEQQPGRLYLGVCAPGVSNKIQAIQTYAALATITRKYEGSIIDPYWTMLGYFNTVKELAGTLTTFKDEVVNRLDMLDPNNTFNHDLIVEEMTSRKKAQEIPALLSQMEKTTEETGVLDAVLATNMISVGVDVDRLGIMVVHGQPKTTSEYIQATSRIGRKYPGLVAVLLNSLRSRDLSHFERFKVYHQALYRNVETMSVTPFASGALRKGLNGALIGYLRQTLLEISNEKGANGFVRNEQVEELANNFIKRVKATGVEASEVETSVYNLLDWWEEVALKYNEKNQLSYKNGQYSKTHLLKQFNEKSKTPESRPAMMSLRNVEGTIEIEVLKK